MSADRIAVVIPSYNHAGFIAEAVRSVLAQTRRPDRFLVIDDGSTDGSLDVLRPFESEGVEVLTQANAGAHNAINRGIRLAGDDCAFVAILNSDDVYEAERLEACHEFLLRRPDSAVVCTRFGLVDGDGSPLPPDTPRARWFRAAWSPAGAPDIDLPEWIGTANFIGTTSNIFARSDYLRANPFRAYQFGHDYFFLCKAILEDRLAVLPRELLRYRVHSANTMNTDPAPLMREMIRIFLDLYRAVGYEVFAQAPMRERFERFARAAWNNISAFHAGVFQTCLARLCAAAREDEIQEVAVVLGQSNAPELHEFPNKALVAAWDGATAIGVDNALADRYEKLKAENRALKQENDALKELARLRQKLLSSKRVALGTLIGKCPATAADQGKSAADKLEHLRRSLAETKWLEGWHF